MSTNHAVGHKAEQDASEWLKAQGFQIVELNWKTKYCEIDIIAKKDGVINFIEVKYRSNNEQGDGFSYITPKKLKQMHFAAEMWLNNNDWDGECTLSAISGDQNGFTFTEIES